jgi:hypothetical protein
LKRIVPLVEDDNKLPIMFTWKENTSPKMKARIKKKLGFVQNDFTQLTDIPEVDIVSQYGLAYGTRTSNGGGRGNAAKSKESVFVYNGGSSWNPESENWDATEVDLDNDNVVYVEINRYKFADEKGTFQDSRRLDTLARRLTLLTGDDVKIIGVKSRQIDKFKNNKNATLAWDRVETEVNKKLKGKVGQWIANERVIAGQDIKYREFFKNLGKCDLGEGSLDNARKAVNKHEDVTKIKDISFIREVMNHYDGIKYDEPEATVSDDTFKNLECLYPLLPLLVESITGYWEWQRKSADEQKKVKANVLHYVNLVNSNVV